MYIVHIYTMKKKALKSYRKSSILLKIQHHSLLHNRGQLLRSPQAKNLQKNHQLSNHPRRSRRRFPNSQNLHQAFHLHRARHAQPRGKHSLFDPGLFFGKKRFYRNEAMEESLWVFFGNLLVLCFGLGGVRKMRNCLCFGTWSRSCRFELIRRLGSVLFWPKKVGFISEEACVCEAVEGEIFGGG